MDIEKMSRERIMILSVALAIGVFVTILAVQILLSRVDIPYLTEPYDKTAPTLISEADLPWAAGKCIVDWDDENMRDECRSDVVKGAVAYNTLVRQAGNNPELLAALQQCRIAFVSDFVGLGECARRAQTKVLGAG